MGKGNDKKDLIVGCLQMQVLSFPHLINSKNVLGQLPLNAMEPMLLAQHNKLCSASLKT